MTTIGPPVQPTFPALREELALLPGPPLPDGQPSWTLHDPTRNLFFRIDWPSFEVLRRWSVGDADSIARQVREETTLSLDASSVIDVAQFLKANQLTRPDEPSSARQLANRKVAIRGSAWTWLLHHYLFFRIPLFRPDAWLAKIEPLCRPVQTRSFETLTALAFLFALIQVSRQWDVFKAQFVDLFSLDGLLAYALALIVVKTLHELGHALTAKRYGCRVPTMGVAFMVLWPMAYTDTNEAWRLTDARKRYRIASAGIRTELMVAVWASFAWALIPDGPLRSALFVLATTSWLTTLAINASPFMRFDGYFILSDLLDLPNLHERSFALARWKLREWLFALNEEPPERFSSRRQRWMIVFAWCTWIYRLVLFIGIALLVYHLFFKALGLFLFVVEIAWFILRPLRMEWRAWVARRDAIGQSGRTRWSVLIVLALLTATLIPWPGRLGASALLRPAESWPLHAPAAALIEALPVAEGQFVAEGAVMMHFKRPELEARRQALQARVAQLRQLAATSSFDEKTRERTLVTEESLATAESELMSLETERLKVQPRAPFAGILRDLDPALRTGQWVNDRERLATLIKADTRWVVETWIEEQDIRRIRVGNRAGFIRDGAVGPVVDLVVKTIDPDASRSLTRRELALQQGGHIPVREQSGQLLPERGIFKVTLEPVENTLPDQLLSHVWRGRISIQAESEAPAMRYFKQAFAVLIREWGF